MQAVIMAGGQGVRLRPMTCDLPKPMVPVLGKPVMEYGIELLKKHGIERMAVTMQYLPGRIMSYFGSGDRQGVKLHYFVENTPLGTAGSVRNAMECIKEPFVVLSGDALVDIDIEKAYAFHRRKGARLTLVLKKSPEPVRFGVVIIDRSGRVVRFQEKPSWDEVFSDLVNTGIYIVEPEIMDEVPEGKPYDFSKDLFPRLLADGCPMYGYVTDGYWCDIGSPEQYRIAHEDFLSGRIRLPIDGQPVGPGIYLSGHPFIHSSATLHAPCYIGEDAYIAEGAVIGPGTVVGRGSRISAGVSIKRSILWDNVIIDAATEIRGAVLCNGVKIAGGTRIFEGVTVGPNTAVGEDVRIHGGVRIWPQKIIENHDEVAHDIVWNHCQPKQLISEGCLNGWINRDITPGYIALAAGAFAGLHKTDLRVGLCCWGSKAAAAILNGFKSSLSLLGLNCDVMEDALPFMLRYAIRRHALAGGVHVAASRGRWRISFYDTYGCALGRKDAQRMESALSQAMTQPVRDARIGEITPLGQLSRQYAREFRKPMDSVLSSLDVLCDDEELGPYCVRQLEKWGYSVRFIKGEHFPGKSDAVAVKITQYGDTLILRDERRRVLSTRQMETLRALAAKKYLSGHDGFVPVSPIFPRALETSLRAGSARAADTGYLASEWMHRLAEEMDERTRITMLDGPAFLLTLDRMLTEESMSLSEMVDRMPTGAIRERRVHCPWESRGNIMRALIKEADPGQTGSGGIKIRKHNNWVFIAPDPASPVFHIFAEGMNEEYAESMIDLYSGKISKLIHKGDP
jgi:mannose-1-phosphate guanylyltransferase/phosphomannomutase